MSSNSNDKGSSAAVYVAVVYHDSDDSSMRQPLLTHEDDDVEVPRGRSKDAATQTEEDVTAVNIHNNVHRLSFPSTMAFGAVVGFFIQVVSLGAYGIMLMNWGEDALHTSKSKVDWFLYAVLAMLTQIDLCIYVVIWLAFTCTMTRSGMSMVRNQLSAYSSSTTAAPPPTRSSCHQESSTQTDEKESQTAVRRRVVFVMGVYFLVGIVLGAFCAWTIIDFYLGFPIPFLPIVVTVVVDLILCYLMVWCYDLGKEETLEDDDDKTGCC